MAKIQRVHLDTLRNDELLAFLHQVERLIHESFGQDNLDLATGFLAKLKKFDISLNNIEGVSAEDLRVADEAADNVWKGIFYELMAGMKSTNEVRRNAAVEVNQVFSMIPNPTDLPYAEEYAQINKLLKLLDELPEKLVRDARVDDWIPDMHRSYDVFMAVNQAHLESLDIDNYDAIKNARTEAMAAYRTMVIGLEVIAPMRKNPQYSQFLSNLNELAARLNLRPTVVDEL